MDIVMGLIPCICKSIQLSMEEAIDIGVRLRQQDPTVADSLLNLVSNLNKYRKEDRKIILRFLVQYLKQNVSIVQSLQATREIPISQIVHIQRGHQNEEQDEKQ